MFCGEHVSLRVCLNEFVFIRLYCNTDSVPLPSPPPPLLLAYEQCEAQDTRCQECQHDYDDHDHHNDDNCAGLPKAVFL